MSEMGPSNVHGPHGGGPQMTPRDGMRPVATLIGVGLAIAVVAVIVLLAR